MLCKFHLFPQLPPELRLIIWTMAILEPRRIYMFCKPENRERRVLTINGTRFVEVPEFFFVNQECREVALGKKYRHMVAAVIACLGDEDAYAHVNLLVRNDDTMVLGDQRIFELHSDLSYIEPLQTTNGKEQNTNLNVGLRTHCNVIIKHINYLFPPEANLEEPEGYAIQSWQTVLVYLNVQPILALRT
ncbi:hypothetical protein F5Y14DRAFT_416498 [Nemania sp. NC0429]|nr:hypothetical protein F5Y14DRAFT_416498 [Nemania sp. NC0429]